MFDFEKHNAEVMAYRNACVDRFNPSTRANYPSTYNPSGCYSPIRNYPSYPSAKGGYYDGAGRYHER